MGTPASMRATNAGGRGGGEVSIGGVFHGAFIRVDEAGTEAAEATALMMVGSAAPGEHVPPPRITIDKPFLFAITNTSTGAIVFLGRVVDPR